MFELIDDLRDKSGLSTTSCRPCVSNAHHHADDRDDAIDTTRSEPSKRRLPPELAKHIPNPNSHPVRSRRPSRRPDLRLARADAHSRQSRTGPKAAAQRRAASLTVASTTAPSPHGRPDRLPADRRTLNCRRLSTHLRRR